MASSNRHWTSKFKSKPCNLHDHQWHHDINPSSIMSTGCHRTPCTSVPGCDERSPEPKPRWNPKPEQIRILEAIFNSGLVNPPRDEIRKIRVQLQEYGQVGDANVFYWFQNRKSRSKHKMRNLQNSEQHSSNQQQITPPTTKPVTTNLAAPSSSSSSSEKSSPRESKKGPSL
ncbi:WUSCHEL-RELATED HOMEOBOX 9 [Salix purpurea]|uniref:WUSCHEL-RELATED HOMEOBOX 9 n=1 Tax=Salix purpurea TaxID=77065 RepID=A0A9Q0WGV3_SALPP|nr:WUSCHEL-RELATED HOMEOBOX 9 [Salix purpurea]